MRELLRDLKIFVKWKVILLYNFGIYYFVYLLYNIIIIYSEVISMWTVYMHKFPNNKVYIGVTGKSLYERFRKDGKGYKNQMVYRAIEKYGWDNIQHIIIAENLSKEQAEKMEIYLISVYKSTDPSYGYNICSGGYVNSGFSFKHSPEAKRKISIASKGHITTKEQIDKMLETKRRNGWYRPSEETKEKLRQIALNMSEEQKKKISNSVKEAWKRGDYANRKYTPHEPWNKGLDITNPKILEMANKHRGYKHSEKTRKLMSSKKKGKPAKNRIKIQCVETGIIYDSISQAHNMTGCNNISNALRNGAGTKGLHWRYYDE